MEKVIIELIQRGPYVTTERTSVAVGHLGNFLTDDVGCRHIAFYKEWLNNPEYIDLMLYQPCVSSTPSILIAVTWDQSTPPSLCVGTGS